MSEKKKCEHKNFHANVDVDRLSKTEGGPIEGFACSVKINCVDCGCKFEFIGLPAGLSYKQPTTSFDFTEMRAPIRPFTDSIAGNGKFEIFRPEKTHSKDIN